MKKLIALSASLLMVITAAAGCNLNNFLQKEQNKYEDASRESAGSRPAFIWEPHEESSEPESSAAAGETDAYSLLMSAREKIRKSNIYIEVELYRKGVNGPVLSRSRSLGSGVVFRQDDGYYYALTNYHVIEYEEYYSAKYYITPLNGKEIEGTVVLQDKTLDLAVVKFSSPPGTIALMDINARDGKELVQNEFLLAVGNPSGVKNNVTYGQYLGLARITPVSYNVLHHNVLINPGNSGGALCDINGNLVGLNTWGSEGADDNNFAIPLNIIKDFLEKLS